MTQQEIENELKSLRAAVLLDSSEEGSSGNRPETLKTGIMFFGWSVLFLSFPLSLLAGALRR
jgi:hypothetical protein